MEESHLQDGDKAVRKPGVGGIVELAEYGITGCKAGAAYVNGFEIAIRYGGSLQI